MHLRALRREDGLKPRISLISRISFQPETENQELRTQAKRQAGCVRYATLRYGSGVGLRLRKIRIKSRASVVPAEWTGWTLWTDMDDYLRTRTGAGEAGRTSRDAF
jgi:hypothetical protein